MFKREKETAVHIRHTIVFLLSSWLRGTMKWERCQELNNRFKQITIKNISKESKSMNPCFICLLY